MSNSLQAHGLKPTRPACPSLSPEVCPSSCPLSRWCRPTISPSADPFSCRLQSFPATGSVPLSQQSTSGGQSIRASASAGDRVENKTVALPSGNLQYSGENKCETGNYKTEWWRFWQKKYGEHAARVPNIGLRKGHSTTRSVHCFLSFPHSIQYILIVLLLLVDTFLLPLLQNMLLRAETVFFTFIS